MIWQVEKIEALRSRDGRENVIHAVMCRLSHADKTWDVWAYLTPPTDSFVPFEELTKEQVLYWAKATLGPEEITKYEDILYDITTGRPTPPEPMTVTLTLP